MASFKLLGFPHVLNARVAKSKIAGALGGVQVDIESAESAQADMALYKQNCQPLGASPVLQTEQGYIFESNAILRHIARSAKGANLYGTTDFEASQVDGWLDYVTSEIDPSNFPFLAVKFGFMTMDEEKTAECTKTVLAALEGINLWLEPRTFLVGERITIADVAIFVAVDGFLRNAGAAAEAAAMPNLVRHYLSVLNNAKVQEAVKAMGGDGEVPEVLAKKE